jgi:hypothetical protein
VAASLSEIAEAIFLITSGALFKSTGLKPTFDVSGITDGAGAGVGSTFRAAAQPAPRQKKTSKKRIKILRT